MTRTRRRAAARIAAAASVILLGPVIGSFASPAGAAVPVAEADYGGYASGVAQFVETADAALALAEVAKANAATEFRPDLPAIANELGREVTPAQPGKHSTANGTALVAELGGEAIPILEPATASAPPSTDLVRNNLLEVPLNPVASATALEGQAQARFAPADAPRCILGEDLARGAGFAANARVIPDEEDDTATLVRTVGDTPERNVNQTTSRNKLVLQTDSAGQKIGDHLGFMSEVRQTLAPVTIAGVGTFEIAGEWVLQAVATGLPGQAFIRYAPEDIESPATPVLTFIPEDDGDPTTPPDITRIVTLQDILGAEGLPIVIPGVAEVTIGEDPRAIGDPPDEASQPVIAADGTSAAAAVDVVRVRLLDGALADIRIGHMEVTAHVPEGGIDCGAGVKVTKESSVPTAEEGDTFTFTLTVENLICDSGLINVFIHDVITTDPPTGINFTLSNASNGGVIEGNSVRWDDLPDLPEVGQIHTVTVDVTLDSVDVAGEMVDNMEGGGDCAVGSATSETAVLNLVSRFELRLPKVLNPRSRTALPETGGREGLVVVGVAFLIALGGAEYLRRRARPEVNPKE